MNHKLEMPGKFAFSVPSLSHYNHVNLQISLTVFNSVAGLETTYSNGFN